MKTHLIEKTIFGFLTHLYGNENKKQKLHIYNSLKITKTRFNVLMSYEYEAYAPYFYYQTDGSIQEFLHTF